MKKFAFLATAAVVTLSSSAALAQDTTRKEARGEVSKAPSFAHVLSLIEGSNAMTARAGVAKAETRFRIDFVDLSTLVTNEADEKLLKEALLKYAEAIKRLRAELSQNPVVVKAIENHPQNVMLRDIMISETINGGRLVIYFWKLDAARNEPRPEMSNTPTAASVVSVLNNSQSTAGAVGRLGVATPLRIDFVDVRPLLASESDRNMFNDAMAKNEDAIKYLREELWKNPRIGKALRGRDLKIGNIVGAELLAGERLVIYFWKNLKS